MLHDEGPKIALNRLAGPWPNSGMASDLSAMNAAARPNLLGTLFMGGLGLLDEARPQSSNALAEIGMLAATIEQRPEYLEQYAAANYHEELQKPYWTKDDAAPVLLGINPVFARRRILEQYRFKDDTAFEAMRLRGLIEQAQEMDDLPEKFRPLQAINWARRQGISVPQELINAAVKLGLSVITTIHPAELALKELTTSARTKLDEKQKQIDDLEALAQQQADQVARLEAEVVSLRAQIETKPESLPAPKTSEPRSSAQTRNYNTAAKLLYGVATAKYGFDLNKPTTQVVSKMLRDLEGLAVRVDDETLVKHLRNGAEQAARANDPTAS